MRLFSLLSFLGLSLGLNAAPNIHVNKYAGHRYFHVRFSLTADAISLQHPPEFFDPRFPEATSGPCELGSNGHFTVYLLKDAFPVASPDCESDYLKLTMPGGGNAEAVSGKRAIWEQITALEAGQRGPLEVVIQLNPYVTVIQKDPLELELDYCNIWFRTAFRAYLPHTEPFQPDENRSSTVVPRANQPSGMAPQQEETENH